MKKRERDKGQELFCLGKFPPKSAVLQGCEFQQEVGRDRVRCDEKDRREQK